MKSITKVKERLWIHGRHLYYFMKWLFLAVLVGGLTGCLGSAFFWCLNTVSSLRAEYPKLVLALPIGGLVIVWLYHICGRDSDKGTNMVIAAVREEESVPVRVTALIFASTILTHLFGGSAGREGAALQMGGSIGNGIARLFRLNRKSINLMILCGMSGAFSALFGTPMAAAIFPMEVVSVGIMYYAALVPCVIASLVAMGIAKKLGVQGECFVIQSLPEFDVISAAKIVLLAILCAGVSITFCILLHKVSEYSKKYIKNPYVRVVAGSFAIVLLTWLLGTQDYLGAGIPVIEQAMEGRVRSEAFLLKMIFTAITLGVGFRGGEIVPTLYIGATFGCCMGLLLGLSPSLCAAVGMAALFCGVTNAPISSLLLSLELFGMEAFPFLMLGIAVSYMLSGYGGLYSSQRIVYSKYKAAIHLEED